MILRMRPCPVPTRSTNQRAGPATRPIARPQPSQFHHRLAHKRVAGCGNASYESSLGSAENLARHTTVEGAIRADDIGLVLAAIPRTPEPVRTACDYLVWGADVLAEDVDPGV